MTQKPGNIYDILIALWFLQHIWVSQHKTTCWKASFLVTFEMWLMEFVNDIDFDKTHWLLCVRKHPQNYLIVLLQLQESEQELRGLQGELQEERRSRVEERRMREEQIHQELQHSQQQEALQLSQAKAELQLMTEKNTELQDEVCVCLCMCVANVSLLRGIWLSFARTREPGVVVTVWEKTKRVLHLFYIFHWWVSVRTLFKQSWIKFSKCVFVWVWPQLKEVSERV